MNPFFLWLKNTFGFSQKEINGFLILLFLMVLMVITPLFLPHKSIPLNTLQDEKIIDSLLTISQNNYQTNIDNNKSIKKSTPKTTIELKKFNPNNCSKEEWISMGISEKIADRIANYLNNGGQFRKKEDLQKIYGFPKKQYLTLFEYIDLPEKPIYNSTLTNSKRNESNLQKKTYEFKVKSFEINSCSNEDLTQIKGIGEKLSERILKYRERLGGFHSAQQYYSIYGLDSIVINQIIQYSTIDTSVIVKININTATYEELKNHVYFDYKTASAIINYRNQHGNYTSVDDLSKIYSIKKETLDKIKPYLKVD